jgi:hypothetical protein
MAARVEIGREPDLRCAKHQGRLCGTKRHFATTSLTAALRLGMGILEAGVYPVNPLARASSIVGN